MDDAAKAKAEETKAKAADAAKKDAELLALAQDRVVERYKKGQGKGAEPAAAGAMPAAAAKGPTSAAEAKGAAPAAMAKGAAPAAVAKGATPAAASTKN
jgi:hypothetical protein